MPKFIILHVVIQLSQNSLVFRFWLFSARRQGSGVPGKWGAVALHGAACRIVVPGPELALVLAAVEVQSLSAGPPTKSQTWNYLLKRLVFLQLNGLGTLVENQLLIDIRFISELSILPHLFIYVSLCHCFYYFHL